MMWPRIQSMLDRVRWRRAGLRPIALFACVLMFVLASCALTVPSPAPTTTPVAARTSMPAPAPAPEPGPAPAALPPADRINLDSVTQSLITHTERTVFLIPFSHWD